MFIYPIYACGFIWCYWCVWIRVTKISRVWWLVCIKRNCLDGYAETCALRFVVWFCWGKVSSFTSRETEPYSSKNPGQGPRLLMHSALTWMFPFAWCPRVFFFYLFLAKQLMFWKSWLQHVAGFLTNRCVQIPNSSAGGFSVLAPWCLAMANASRNLHTWVPKLTKKTAAYCWMCIWMCKVLENLSAEGILNWWCIATRSQLIHLDKGWEPQRSVAISSRWMAYRSIPKLKCRNMI